MNPKFHTTIWLSFFMMALASANGGYYVQNNSTGSTTNSTSSHTTWTVTTTGQGTNPEKSENSALTPDSFPETQQQNSYDDRSAERNRTAPMNASYPLDQSGFSTADTPSATLSCPGPLDPNTGEAVLDEDQNCAIVCYNNLVLNEAGNACICPPTFSFDPVEVRCICRSPFVQRGSKCVLLPSQGARARQSNHKKRSLSSQMPLGFDMLHGKYRRTDLDRRHCPDNEIACQMESGGFECLDPEVTLDSCGGCASTGTGVDCRNITGAGDVGCNAGVCVVISCQQRFQLVDGVCVPKPTRKR